MLHLNSIYIVHVLRILHRVAVIDEVKRMSKLHCTKYSMLVDASDFDFHEYAMVKTMIEQCLDKIARKRKEAQ